MTANSFGRREFLRRTSAAGAGLAAALLDPGSLRAAPKEKVRLGFIGVGRRGLGHVERTLLRPDVEIPAVCDVDQERLGHALDLVAKAKGKRAEGYGAGEEDYRRMVARDDLDGVIIATPWAWHGPMTLATMKAGKYAGVETPGLIELQECWDVVKVWKATGTPCMLLENVCYGRRELAVLNMVRQGLFGEITHCQCGNQHDVRPYQIAKDGSLGWFGRHLASKNRNWSPTHGVGPVCEYLDINRGNRFVSLTSTASKSRGYARYIAAKSGPQHPDARRGYATGDVITTVLKCHNGESVVCVYDQQSPRPYSHMLRVQGTKGIFMEDGNSIYVEGRTKGSGWEPATQYLAEFDHPLWKRFNAQARTTTHGGMDFFVDHAFVEAIKRGVQPPIDTWDTATWSAIIALSGQSHDRGSAPVEFPDFTEGKWAANKRVFGLTDEY
jgi:predicted dehydrogenase